MNMDRISVLGLPQCGSDMQDNAKIGATIVRLTAEAAEYAANDVSLLKKSLPQFLGAQRHQTA
jgi:hypothetical protein